MTATWNYLRPGGCNRRRIYFGQRGAGTVWGAVFWGRIGVFEVAAINDPLRDAVARGGTEAELRNLLRSTGTVSLLDDALGKVREGVTSVTEALEMSAL